TTRYYNARSNAAGNSFKGYYEVTVKGDFTFPDPDNLFNPYTSLQYVTPPMAILGIEDVSGNFVSEQREYTCTLPISLGKGGGPIVSTLNMSCFDDPVQTSDPYNTNLPPITTAEFTNSQQYKICDWNSGTYIKVQQGNGNNDSFYISEDASNPGEYIIYRWNCFSG